jgi:hypothetical protein
MIFKLSASIVALGIAGFAHGQEGPTVRTLWALPATACVANTPADEAFLQRSIEGLRNISPTRTVWVTCSMPTVNFRTPPYDDVLVLSLTMRATTNLPQVTVPCRAAINVGTGPGEFVYFWEQETTSTERVAIVSIEPTTDQVPHRTFGMTCKIPQSSALTEFQVDIAQVDRGQ